MRNLLLQRDVGEKRENWVTTLQEYDIEIRRAKIVEGQGFCRILARESILSTLQDSGDDIQVYEVSLNDTESKYVDIIFYLKNGYAPMQLSYKIERALKLKARQNQIINNVLYRINYDSIFLRCLETSEAEKVLRELHDGYFGGDTIAYKILHVGYYWPTFFKDAHDHVRKCKVCQTAVGRQRKPALPLQPVNIEQPFQK